MEARRIGRRRYGAARRRRSGPLEGKAAGMKGSKEEAPRVSGMVWPLCIARCRTDLAEVKRFRGGVSIGHDIRGPLCNVRFRADSAIFIRGASRALHCWRQPFERARHEVGTSR